MKQTQAHSTSPALQGFYIIGAAAAFLGLFVVFLLNVATPVEFVITQRQNVLQGGKAVSPSIS